MNTNQKNSIPECSRPRWPFQRRSAAWLPTLTLCLFGYLSPATADPNPNPNYPKDANVSVGASVTFQVSATSTNPPLTYQWQHAGTDLPGATNATLVLTNVTVAHAGGYMAWITNASGAYTNTRNATLTVDPTFVKIIQPDIVGGSDMWMPYWVDFDGDGWLELVVAGGAYTPGGKPLLVYENNRDGTLSRIQTNDLSKVSGRIGYLAWADLDNDGDLDAFVGTWEGETPLYLRNEGGGRFTKVLANRWWTANGIGVLGSVPACADFDNDGILDLVVAYMGNLPTGTWGTNTVLRGLGDGRFEVDRTSPLAISHSWVENWGWADWDGDGDLDLFGATSDDQNPSQMAKDVMFQNLGGGQFLRITNSPLVGVADFSFVPAWGDYDNDRDLDLCVASEEHTISLYRNLGSGAFEPDPASPSFPVGQTRRVGVWGDYDNDGWLDLFMTHRDQPSRLFHNRGDGTFEEITTGSPVTECRGFGAAWGDYNNDGLLDLCTANGNTGVLYLYRNNLSQAGKTNGWLKVKLVGSTSNRGGIGATIRVKATIGGKELWQMRQIVCQSSQAELMAHFGLGDATSADLVRIEWPSGNVQELANVAPNQFITVTEPTLITPARPSASLNGSVTLARTGVAGATYQWQFNGVDLVSQTNRTLNLTNIVADQEGRYSVVVSNATTLVTNFVYLHVDTQFTKVTTGAPVTDVANSWLGSWGDYDVDGYPDLFVARFNTGRNGLYHNNGDGTFTSITTTPFVQTADAWISGAWADLDNDGRPDLVATRAYAKPAIVYFNNSDGTFSQIQLLEDSPNNIAVIDYNNDGLLDLLLYGNVTLTSPSTSWLYRNNGDRTFTRMKSNEVGSIVGFAGSGAGACADYDDDGSVDAFCSNAAGASRLVHNDGTGRFVVVTNLFQGAGCAGAWGDYDNDGRLDLCVSSWGGSVLVYHNLGDGKFERAAIGQTLGGNYLSASWADYDNDGFLDLFLTSTDPAKNVLYHNNGDGTFSRITTGSIVTDVARNGVGSWAALWFDYDNNGFLDLYTFNNDINGAATSANFLYHNNGNANFWLKVKLVGTASNRDGVGAKVRVLATYAGQSRWQRRDITGGDLYNGNQLYAHFGLGNATKVTTLRVEWPSGAVQVIPNVTANQVLTVYEPPALSAAVRADGACELTIKAEPNRGWQIQASSDLLTWQTLTTVTNISYQFQFTDPAAAGMNCQFYRVESK